MHAARWRQPTDWGAPSQGAPDQAVEAFLDRLDRLAARAPKGEAFYADLLEASSVALAAAAAERWVFDAARDEARLAGRFRAGGAPFEDCREAVEAACRDQTARVIDDPATGSLVCCPVRDAGGVVGALAYRFPLSAGPADDRLAIASAVAESAGRFELAQQARRLGAAAPGADDEFLLGVHGTNQPDQIARLTAEAARLACGADRAALLTHDAFGWSVAAVSGVDRPNRRSDTVRQMERLATAALTSADTVVVDDGRPALVPAAEAPPQLLEQVDRYAEATGCRQLIVTSDSGEEDSTKIALLVERRGAGPLDEAAPRLRPVLRHARVALDRSRERSLVSRGRVRWLAISGAAAAALAAVLMLVPATLRVSVDGRLVPVDRGRVFAPMDGVVEQVLVGHAESVTVGQPLLRMRSAELEIQIEQTAEAIASTEQEIASLETAKLRGQLPGAGDGSDPTAIAARIEALREQLTHQQSRRRLLAQEADRLEVVSPIDGALLSWRPEGDLIDRPVRRGQRLLEVADTDGAWRLESDAPDHRVGPIVEAWRSGGPLAATFVIKSDPGAQHEGRVTRVASATGVDAAGRPTVRIEITPAGSLPDRPRSGLAVAAKIECGRHSLGYVWFHEALRTLQRHWF